MERYQGHSGKVGFEVPVRCHGGGGMHESGPQGRDLGTSSADADGSCRGRRDALMRILVGENIEDPGQTTATPTQAEKGKLQQAPCPADALWHLVSRKTNPHHYLLWWAPPSVLPQCGPTLPAPAHPVLYSLCRFACLGYCIPFPPELLKGPEVSHTGTPHFQDPLSFQNPLWSSKLLVYFFSFFFFFFFLEVGSRMQTAVFI